MFSTEEMTRETGALQHGKVITARLHVISTQRIMTVMEKTTRKLPRFSPRRQPMK